MVKINDASGARGGNGGSGGRGDRDGDGAAVAGGVGVRGDFGGLGGAGDGDSAGAGSSSFGFKGETGNQIYVELYDGASNPWSTGGTITPNQWHHVAVVRDTDSFHIYLNGTRVQSFSDTTNNIANTTDFMVGYTSNAGSNGYFNGIIDGVKVFLYARTADQIAWDYNLGEPLVAYKFDECSGATAYNSVQNAQGTAAGNNLTLYPQSNLNTAAGTCNSGITTEMRHNGTTGKRNAAVDFDGDDDYAATNNVALVYPWTIAYTRFSFGGWFKPATSPASDTLIHKNSEFRLTTDGSGKPQCEIQRSGWQPAVTGSTALPVGSWSHVLCVYDGASLKLYVDAKLAKSLPQTNGIISDGNTALNLARDSAGSGYFDGQMDSVKIWNYPLTQTLIDTEFAGGAVSFGQ